LENAVLSILNTLALSDAEIQYLCEWIAEHRQHAEEECETQKRATMLHLESLRTRLSRLTDLLLEGSLEKSVFDEKQKAFVWEVAELRQKLAALEAGRDDALKEIENTVELAKSPPLLYKTSDQEGKRELLRILLSNLTVSGKTVSVELKIPFRLIAEREKASHCRPYRETCRTWEKLLEQLVKHFTGAITPLN